MIRARADAHEVVDGEGGGTEAGGAPQTPTTPRENRRERRNGRRRNGRHHAKPVRRAAKAKQKQNAKAKQNARDGTEAARGPDRCGADWRFGWEVHLRHPPTKDETSRRVMQKKGAGREAHAGVDGPLPEVGRISMSAARSTSGGKP